LVDLGQPVDEVAGKGTKIDDMYSSIQNLTGIVNKCFESVKVNQQMINNMMIMTVRLNEQMKKLQAKENEN
jgi:hypothetical protein